MNIFSVGDGKEYELKDKNFPTIDPNDPYKLTKEEEYVMEHLVTVFKYCAYLQEHIRFLFAKGHLYKVFNGMLHIFFFIITLSCQMF